MKRFLKKRWRSIPVALVSALLVVVLVGGGVFAYNTWISKASVTVVEPTESIVPWSVTGPGTYGPTTESLE